MTTPDQLTEETRAAAYRAQAATRLQSKTTVATGLNGDASAAASVRTAWRPLLDWMRERLMPPLPTPEDLQEARTTARHRQVASLPGLAGTDLARDLPIKDPDV